jgi:prophage maintenance system killer protein
VTDGVDVTERSPADRRLPRVNLAAVDASLRRLQKHFARDVEELALARDPMDDRVIDNMVAGYAFVDTLVAEGVSVLAMGHHRHLLEMNTIVLCGTNADRRAQYTGHIEATERRFYEEREGGIQDLVEWYQTHERESVWDRAAGAYVRMLSKPQLFIEGNHRTGALLMSHILQRDGLPPFVLSVDSAADYFDPSTTIRDVDKNSPATIFRLSRVRDRLAKLLQERSDPRYLLA